MDEELDPAGRVVSTRRLESFTDGVFAIAATLLVLDLSVTKLGPAIANDSDLWSALGGQSHALLSFAISFVLLGMLWTIHVWEFEFIGRVTQTLAFLNTLRLMGIVLIPFTTSLSSNFPDLMAGRLLLPINFLVVCLIGAAQWGYATRSPLVGVHGLSAESLRATKMGTYVAVLSAVITLALAPWLGAYAFLAFVLNPIADRIPALRRPRRPARSARTADPPVAG